MPDTDEIIYLDAILTPNSSLSRRGFVWFMALVGMVSAATSVVFIQIGFLPVIAFVGLMAGALLLAFYRSYRHQKEETQVRVTARNLSLRHRNAKGETRLVNVPSSFARVELDEPLRPDSWLRIEHGRTAYVIGRFLTPPERKSLADALRTALAEGDYVIWDR